MAASPQGARLRGHRFLGSAAIRVRAFSRHEKQLRSNGVIVRRRSALDKIQRELAAHTKQGSLHVHQDADLLQARHLLERTPVSDQGRLRSFFLNLPDEILVTVMRGHQKYFR